MHFRHGKTIRNFLAVVASAGVVACSPTFKNYGFVPPDSELEKIVIGTDTRATVEELLSRPTSSGALSEGAWYYISSQVRYYTYNNPEVIERNIVAITFDDSDTVSNIERFGIEDGRLIAFSQRTTESGVAGTSFFRQLARNVGNFDAADFLEEQ